MAASIAVSQVRHNTNTVFYFTTEHLLLSHSLVSYCVCLIVWFPIVYILLFCFLLSYILLSVMTIVSSHTIGQYWMTCLLSCLLLLRLTIVLVYYTALHRSSITSSTPCIGLSK